MLDTSIPLKRAQQNTVDQFIGHLKGGPFLGGMTEPSLADLSAYPIIVFPHRLGVLGDANWSNHPEVKAWAKVTMQLIVSLNK